MSYLLLYPQSTFDNIFQIIKTFNKKRFNSPILNFQNFDNQFLNTRDAHNFQNKEFPK